MAHTNGIGDYLEAIYILESEGETVLSSKVADYLNVSRPTVTQTMQRLIASGEVTIGEGKEILLTSSGRKKAEAQVRRHRILERWLADELGLDWADAHVEAARLEHAVSPLVEQKLYERLGQPGTCPHGNVIPGSGHAQPSGTSLLDLNGKEGFYEVVRIVEIAEEDLDLLRFLHHSGIVPGRTIQLEKANSPYEAGIRIQIDNHSLVLNKSVAQRILVSNLPV